MVDSEFFRGSRRFSAQGELDSEQPFSKTAFGHDRPYQSNAKDSDATWYNINLNRNPNPVEQGTLRHLTSGKAMRACNFLQARRFNKSPTI